MEKYSRNDQVIDGELDDNQVMMHLEKAKYYGLNPIGKYIWALLETPKSFDEITTALLSEFEVSEEQCIEETKKFIDKATEFDILKKI